MLHVLALLSLKFPKLSNNNSILLEHQPSEHNGYTLEVMASVDDNGDGTYNHMYHDGNAKRNRHRPVQRAESLEGKGLVGSRG